MKEKLNEIDQQIFDLVSNDLDKTENPVFVREQVALKTPEEIVQLARDELKAIEYYIRISNKDFNYWREKRDRLLIIILRYKQDERI